VTTHSCTGDAYLKLPRLLPGESISTMDCVMRHANKLINSDNNTSPIRNQIYYASMASLLTQMWPSLVHFMNFSKDKEMQSESACRFRYWL
jgi:hypothetical protein